MDHYTWKQFKAVVMGFLPVDANRLGAETYNESLLRQGVIHFQSLIPALKINHEAIYHPSDLTVDGRASRGTKPPQSTIKDIWLFETNPDDRSKGKRHPVTEIPWSRRFELINGTAGVASEALICVEPGGDHSFYIYPEVFDGWLVSMFWDGAKLDFKEEEQVPFTEQLALTVAEFMRAKIEREVKRDLSMANSFEGSAANSGALMFLDLKEQSGVKG